MTNRLWGGLDFLSRRSSVTAPEDSDEDSSTMGERCKSSSRVQTLCNMRARPSSGTDSPAGSTASGHDVLAQHQQPHHHQLTGSKVDYCHMQDKSNDLHHASAVDALGSHPKGIENALVDKDPAAALQLAAANMEPLTQQQQQQHHHQQGRLPQLSSSGQHDQHDSASSSAGGDGMLSTSCALLVQQQQAEGDTANSPDTHPAAVAAQVSNQGLPAATALSSGTTRQSVTSDGPSGALQCLHQQQPKLQRPAPGDGPPPLQNSSPDAVDPAWAVTVEGSSSSTYEPGPPGHHQLDSTALNGDVAAAAAAAVALQATTAGLAAASAKGAAGMLMMHAGGTAAAAAAAPNNFQQLLAELQEAAGLSDEQAASAAAVLQRFAGGSSGPSPPPPPAAAAAISESAVAGNLLSLEDQPHWQQGQDSSSCSNPVVPACSNYLGAVATAASGLESGQSSSSNNVQLCTIEEASAAFSSQSLSTGLSDSPDMVHGIDGRDTPGTAQVAVHNVPFKWCNTDLEALFHRMPGYLDAQLLFHENGRSKGVGVVLFSDANAAADAAGKLSGAQADGRKLEMVLMNSDNHISFSCKQVAVLGLPWEYTAADVRALIEAAAEADGTRAAEAGVEAVEVAYRDDGKSEGRAIATFRSRLHAHAAITRLHGKETLAGLRMRLFYLHEQQQRQDLLSQAPGTLLTSMGQLSLDTPSPAVAGAGLLARNANKVDPAAVALGGLAAGDWGPGPLSSRGSVEGDRLLGGGTSGRGSLEQAVGETAPAGDGSSARSSFDKDQGPVILHVSGLMESVSREQLRELFSQAGEVTKVDIPDGGRSMGYGFITFNNPQAAEQAMLLFNNYPLGGGAIHVAYSTSATAKARQQALRQARKATLGGARSSMDAGAGSNAAAINGSGQPPSGKPTTPRGKAAGKGTSGVIGIPDPQAGGGVRRAGGVSFEGPHSGHLGSIEPLQGLNPVRHSFDHPGYTSGLTSPATAAGIMARTCTPSAASGLNLPGSTGNSAALQGLDPAGGRAGRGGFEPAPVPAALTPLQLQLLQAGRRTPPAAAVAATAAAAQALSGGLGHPPMLPGSGLDGLNLDQLQLLMQLGDGSGTTRLGGGLGPGLSGAACNALASMAAGGLGFNGMMGCGSGAPGAAGMFPAAGATGGLLGGGAGPAGLLGPTGLGVLPQLQGSGGGLLPPSGNGARNPVGVPMPSTQLLVMGLPAGLGQDQLAQLFELCGRLRGIYKPRDKEYVLVTFETLEGAIKAVQVLNGTSLPSGGTLSVHFAPVRHETGAAAAGQPGIGSLGLFDQGVANAAAAWGQSTGSTHSRRMADPAAFLGDVFAGTGAAGSPSPWPAPDAASGLTASAVGNSDVGLPFGGHDGFGPAASGPLSWDFTPTTGAPSSPPAGGNSSQGRPPFSGLYSRAVGSNRSSGDAAASTTLYSTASPLRSNSPANAPVPGAASVYASPLYKASSAGDLFSGVTSSSALSQQHLGSGSYAVAGTGEYASSGSLPVVQLPPPHQALLRSSGAVDGRGAFPMEELPSDAVAAAWGDLATLTPMDGGGGSEGGSQGSA